MQSSGKPLKKSAPKIMEMNYNKVTARSRHIFNWTHLIWTKWFCLIKSTYSTRRECEPKKTIKHKHKHIGMPCISIVCILMSKYMYNLLPHSVVVVFFFLFHHMSSQHQQQTWTNTMVSASWRCRHVSEQRRKTKHEKEQTIWWRRRRKRRKTKC